MSILMFTVVLMVILSVCVRVVFSGKYLGSCVAETENWKHYSKIIFKCVKSTVVPIFNIFKCVNSTATVCEQWFLYVHSKFTVHALEKKKGREREMKTWTQVSAETKRSHSEIVLSLSFIMDFTMNLMSEPHHNYERRENHSLCS